jgi:hypothetical protein
MEPLIGYRTTPLDIRVPGLGIANYDSYALASSAKAIRAQQDALKLQSAAARTDRAADAFAAAEEYIDNAITALEAAAEGVLDDAYNGEG